MGHNITDSGIDTRRGGEGGQRGSRVCIAVGLNIEAAADIYLKWREGGRRRRRLRRRRRRVRVYRKAETTQKKERKKKKRSQKEGEGERVLHQRDRYIYIPSVTAAAAVELLVSLFLSLSRAPSSKSHDKLSLVTFKIGSVEIVLRIAAVVSVRSPLQAPPRSCRQIFFPSSCSDSVDSYLIYVLYYMGGWRGERPD